MQNRTNRRVNKKKEKGRVDILRIVIAAQLLIVTVLFSFSGMPFTIPGLPAVTPEPTPTPDDIPTQMPTEAPTPEPTPTPPPAWLKNIVKYKGPYSPWIMTWQYRPNTLEAVPPGVNALAPTWLYVEADDEGRAQLVGLNHFGTRYDEWDPDQYVQTAHDGQAAVWVTVVSFTPELSEQVVKDSEVQAEFIQGICDFYERYRLDGLNFDFEKMNPEHKLDFSQLVANTKAALPETAVVSVSVTVPLGYDAPNNWWQCYDRASLAKACDYVIVMAYDSSTMASAPYDWVERRVQMTLEEVPSDKLIMALPFYGSQYVYYPDGNADKHDKKYNYSPSQLASLLENGEFKQGNTAFKLEEWLEQGKYIPEWEVYEYSFMDTDGNRHLVYMDGADTIERKGTLTQKYALAGAGVWQMPFGTDALWNALRKGVDTEMETPQ